MSTGLLYTAAFENISVTDAVQDIAFIASGATVPLWIHEIQLTANHNIDVRVRLQLLRRTTAGSAGTGVTPRANDEHNTRAASATATVLRTTPGTGGNVLDGEQWSLLVPFNRLYTPETRIRVAAASFFGVNLVAMGLGATRSMSGKIVFAE